MFAKIVQAESPLIARVKDNIAFVVQEERPLTDAAKAAGVIRDVVISRLGTPHHKDHFKRAMRLVIARVVAPDDETIKLWPITDRFDLPGIAHPAAAIDAAR